MKTYSVSKNDIERKWYLIDANDVRLGKLASEVAMLLMGKNKKLYAKNLNTGDCVIVTNIDKISVSANKEETKKYYTHSRYVGSLKEETLGHLLARKPEEVIIHAVKGMLPKNKLQSPMLKNLYLYVGSEHKHEAQSPVKFEIK